jgi:membrane protein implicated in regulation of membrane protease activity
VKGGHAESRRISAVMKRIDPLVVLLVAILAAFAIAASYAALHFGWFGSPWQFAMWLLISLAFLVVGVPAVGHRMTRQANVHGSARPASQDEARKAARGDAGASPLHDQTFED